MRLAPVMLVLLAGCDLVFGTTSHDKPDAAGDDADPTDGQQNASCPSSGAPMFQMGNAEPVNASNCVGYSATSDSTLAVAFCGTVQQGPIDGPFTPAVFNVTHERFSARIAPDGDELYVYEDVTTGTDTYTLSIYNADTTGWKVQANDFVVAFAGVAHALEFSTPTRQIAGRRAILVQVDGGAFDEYWEKPAPPWEMVRSHDLGELGVEQMTQPNLSPDGKRLVFVGSASGGPPRLMYARRTAVGLKFDTAVPIDVGVDTPQYPYLRPDCGRLYFNFASNVLGFLRQ